MRKSLVEYQPITRREFVCKAASASGVVFAAGQLAGAETHPLTVGDVLQRIKQHVGIPWRAQTVDNVLAGTNETVVRGIAATMMATFDVCRRAQAIGANFIITHETPFYLHQDKTDDIQSNAVLRAKKAFLQEHDMAILHFHDHLHAMHPDGVALGMIQQLGWQAHQVSADDPKHLHFAGISLSELADDISTKLNARTLRVVGDGKMPVHNVQTSWGYCSREGGIAILSDPATEVLICGETREWELVEYVQDAITAGQSKALIVVGHVLSEQGGMIFATGWLKRFITEVPVTFVPAPEPFWLAPHPG